MSAPRLAEVGDLPTRPDASSILDDVVGIIGTDVVRIKALVDLTERVLTGEEARNLAGYCRALVDVAKARKADDGGGLSPKEQQDLDELMEKCKTRPELKEILDRINGGER